MKAKINIPIGSRFGKLITTSAPFLRKANEKSKFPIRYVSAICECGKDGEYTIGNLRYGHTKSCGCLSISILIKNRRTHGLRFHPLYNVWRGMINRCYNKNGKHYNRWGQRGITVCDEWKNSFQTYYDWAIANGWQKGLTIDRRNNDGNYEPNNCRIATPSQQAQNRSTTKLTMKDAIEIKSLRPTKSTKQLSNMYNVSEHTIRLIVRNKTWTI